MIIIIIPASLQASQTRNNHNISILISDSEQRVYLIYFGWDGRGQAVRRFLQKSIWLGGRWGGNSLGFNIYPSLLAHDFPNTVFEFCVRNRCITCYSAKNDASGVPHCPLYVNPPWPPDPDCDVGRQSAKTWPTRIWCLRFLQMREAIPKFKMEGLSNHRNSRTIFKQKWERLQVCTSQKYGEIL